MARVAKSKTKNTDTTKTKSTRKSTKKEEVIVVDETPIREQVIEPIKQVEEIKPKTSKKPEVKEEVKKPEVKKFKAQNLSDFLY